VLIVDIRRPMPQPFDAVNRLAQAIMKPVYGRPILKKLAGMTPPVVPGAAIDPQAIDGRRAGADNATTSPRTDHAASRESP